MWLAGSRVGDGEASGIVCVGWHILLGIDEEELTMSMHRRRLTRWPSDEHRELVEYDVGHI